MTIPAGFDWDHAKAASNLKKHALSFHEGATVFLDPMALTVHDLDHSLTEDRFVTIGFSVRSRLPTVIYADKPETIRIICVRRPTRREETQYTRQD